MFSYRGDDEHGRMSYDGDWKNKAAHGYGVMRWQNGDRSDQPFTQNKALGNLIRHSFSIWKKIESMISIDDISIQIDISTYPTLMLILLFPTGTKATGLKD